MVVFGRALLFCLLASGCLSAPPYHGAVSDHFDGNHFRNNPVVDERGFADFMRWRARMRPGHWEEWTENSLVTPPPARVDVGQMHVTFINHATTLIQVDGLNILTDPIWSDRASPFAWVGPARKRPPGIALEELPQIHVVLISHSHYDHCDLPTLKKLQERHHPKIIAGLGTRAFLEKHGLRNVVELDWWQREKVSSESTVLFTPAQHWSNRSLRDRNRLLWGSFVIEGPAGRIYFAGDSGFGPHLAEIRRRTGPMRLALLPIGAYRPEWFMSPHHMSPREAVMAHKILDARTSVAIHYGTFHLGDDGQDEPAHALVLALEQANLKRSDFWLLQNGQGRDVP